MAKKEGRRRGSAEALQQPFALKPPQRPLEPGRRSLDVCLRVRIADEAPALEQVYAFQKHARLNRVQHRLGYACLEPARPYGPPPVGWLTLRPLQPDHNPERGALAVYEAGHP